MGFELDDPWVLADVLGQVQIGQVLAFMTVFGGWFTPGQSISGLDQGDPARLAVRGRYGVDPDYGQGLDGQVVVQHEVGQADGEGYDGLGWLRRVLLLGHRLSDMGLGLGDVVGGGMSLSGRGSYRYPSKTAEADDSGRRDQDRQSTFQLFSSGSGLVPRSR
jgi:hypothetical protein